MRSLTLACESVFALFGVVTLILHMLPVSATLTDRRRRPLTRATPPRLTLRRGLAILGVLVGFFYFIRATSPSPKAHDCVDTRKYERPLARDTVFVHPSTGVKYLPFEAAGVSSTVGRDTRLLQGDALPSYCVEDHFETGSPCHTLTTKPLDFVWTWVNSSDSLIASTMNSLAAPLKKDPNLGRPFQAGMQPKNYR